MFKEKAKTERNQTQMKLQARPAIPTSHRQAASRAGQPIDHQKREVQSLYSLATTKSWTIHYHLPLFAPLAPVPDEVSDCYLAQGFPKLHEL